MKIFYNGREVAEAYAKMLENNGQAHFGSYDPVEEIIIMEAGPNNNWLEKQDPEVFLWHVFGHTCTWAEMARDWEKQGQFGMTTIAERLSSLNYWINQVLSGRREQERIQAAKIVQS